MICRADLNGGKPEERFSLPRDPVFQCGRHNPTSQCHMADSFGGKSIINKRRSHPPSSFCLNLLYDLIAVAALVCAGLTCCIPTGALRACHPDVAKTYRQTGMARSFYRPTAETEACTFTSRRTLITKWSSATGVIFSASIKPGLTANRRTFAKREIDFVLGSGNHAWSYLHRTAKNTLVLLPLAW